MITSDRSQSGGIVEALAAAKAPQQIVAILESLQFDTPSTRRLDQLIEKEWHKLLCWCDARQLTLLLAHICGSSLPPDIRANILEKRKRYEIRFERLKTSLFEISDAFQTANLEFILLKGLSHAPAMTPDALLRAQGDIDLWLRGPSVYKAQKILHDLGYASVTDSRSRHLGSMARPTNWQWRGDYFDSEMPISVELHYALWSAEAEYVAAPQLEQFWERRTVRNFDGYSISVLCDQDLLGFSALHLLLHLLHGDLPLQRAWEIARFVDAHADDEQFWEKWQSLHCLQLRQLETPMYYLVSRWFGCRWPQCLDTEVANLTGRLKFWLDKLYLSPLMNEWRPNKREVWLHLALIENRRDKAKVLLRRLFPVALARAPQRATYRTSLVLLVRHLQFIGARLLRHIATLAPTILDGLRLVVLRRL